MRKYDLIIVGGGAGAFAAAIRADELGAKTALINSGLPLGGTCVNVGCVPSKTLIHAAETLHRTKHHNIPGIEIEVKNFDFSKVMQDELALVEKLRNEKYEKVLAQLKNVSLVEGKATFVSTNEVEVNGEKLTADKFIIAAGSTATVPPIDGLKETGFITHIEALKLERPPKELVVIGAGPLGLEFAQLYSRFGTKVTILQRGSSIFPPAEKELTDRLQEILEKEGIVIKTDVEVLTARKDGEKKIVTYSSNGKQ
ncbi:MAG: FAD-dependent oxidoreductase, partial [Patescibacteria group bacterium]|nr:FAD-dependent oxidoreductase [Patescibacteria group bacterium]